MYCVYKHILGKYYYLSLYKSCNVMTDPRMWLCLQWDIGYTDAEPPAPIVSHEPKLEFGPIRVNFQILEVWAQQLTLSVVMLMNKPTHSNYSN